MTEKEWDVGDKIKLSVAFTDANGPADPTAVTGQVYRPDGSIVTLTPQSSEVGTWWAEYTTTRPGLHHYVFSGTGTVVKSEEGTFYVRHSIFSLSLMNSLEQLRDLIAEPDETNFTDVKLLQYLAMDEDEDVFATAALIWRLKQGNSARFYNAQVDGATMTRAQFFDHCKMMAEYYEGRAGVSAAAESVLVTSNFLDEEGSEFA